MLGACHTRDWSDANFDISGLANYIISIMDAAKMHICPAEVEMILEGLKRYM
jgi:hypothetical protein